MAVQVGAQYLERPYGGRGILLGGVPGVAPANVVILGGGVVGTNAAKMAVGMGAHVTIIDRNLNRLRELDDIFSGQRGHAGFQLPGPSARTSKTADLVVGAVLIPGASAPKLVRREMIATMKRGAVVVDVAIDQGGCFETSHATTHTEPIYFVDGVLHYCVSNMPAAVPHTSTFALTNATFPYLLELANHGPGSRLRAPRRAARGRQHLQRLRHAQRRGANRRGGEWRELARGGVSWRTCRQRNAIGSASPSRSTALTEDEKLFQTTVRKFAREQIRPYVREMDEAGVFRKDIIRQFFEMGLMGIEIPEEYGGQGGSFFQAILAVEELSAVDPSAGVIVDVQNTICNNALLRWATPEQKARYLPRLAADTVASYALSEAGSGSDAFAMATRAEDRGDHFLLNGRKLWITNAAEAGLFLLFANASPEAGYKGITAFLVEREFPGFQVGKKEDKLGLRASSTCELILDNCRVPRENVMGEVGQGYKIAIETLNEGRIAIGAQMIGLARGALEHAIGLRPRAQAVRQAHRRISGRAVRAGQNGHRGRSRAPAGLQRRPPAGRRTCRS